MADYEPLVCLMTNSTCYKNTAKMSIKGVLWHSTGANNPWIKRYCQPSDNDPRKAEILRILGKNKYGNDLNHKYRNAGVNAWVGKAENGDIMTAQALPWNFRPWGCGTRYKNGPSCNDGWIQFEICEDDLKNKSYAQSVWDEAVRLTAFLCSLYNLDPFGYVPKKDYYGKMVQVPVILDHKASYDLGFGSGHGDISHWFPKILGKGMKDARQEVYNLLHPGKYPVVPFTITVKESGKTGYRDSGYSSGKYLGELQKGIYTIDAVNNDFGHASGMGWVYLIDPNIEINGQKSMDGYTVGKFYTVAPQDGLWLRKTPGGEKIKCLPYGTVVLCQDLCKKDGNTYMQIADSNGWVAAHYNGQRYVN